MRKITMLLIALIGISQIGLAQVKCNLKKNPELKNEMRTYYNQTVYPELKESHSQLDRNLPAADLNTLQKLRADNKQLQADKKALNKEMRAQVKAGKTKEEARAALAPKFQQQREANGAIRKQLRPITERNHALVKGAVDVLKPKREQWKKDKHAITLKYYSQAEIDACKKAKASQKSGPHRGGNGKMNARPQGGKPHLDKKANSVQAAPNANQEKRKEMRQLSKFLLWDGELREEFTFEDKETPAFGNQRQDSPQMGLGQNYPNPARATTTIDFTLPQATDYLTVTITDQNGKKVQELSYEGYAKGAHSLNIKLKGLTSGNYFYTIQGEGFRETKQMSIVK